MVLETVVIGAGIAGFSAALALWERGAAVTVVETGRPGGGATGASAGMVTAQYESYRPTPLFRLCVESRARYPDFAAKVEELSGRDLGVRWDGILVANFSEKEHEDAVAAAAWQREAGLEAEVLEPGRAQEIQAGVTSAALSYLWFPGEGQLDSQELAAALGEAIAHTGIRLITDNGAARIRSEGGVVTGVVMADGRSLEADRVVLAAGAWSSAIAGLPRPLPIRPIRGQMLRFAPGVVALGRVVGNHAGRYLVPRGDGSILAGSTMEDVGFDRSITEDGTRVIHEGVSQLVPDLSGQRPIERWAGLRPVSADGLPVIGTDPELEGLVYATGFGRYGITVAPLAGSVVAELAVSGESWFDCESYRPDRFSDVPDSVG